MEVKNDYVQSVLDPSGHLLVLLFLAIKVSEKLEQPNPDRMTKGTDTAGMKVWFTPPVREPRPAEVLAEGGGNAE